MADTHQVAVSLLYPDISRYQPKQITNTTKWTADIDLDPLVGNLSIDTKYRDAIRQLLTHLTTSEVIIRYRQDILGELLEHPNLVAGLRDVLDIIALLSDYSRASQWRESQLRLIAWRVSELESYIQCIMQLNSLMTQTSTDFKSEGLSALHQVVKMIINDPLFQQLQEELPVLAKEIRNVTSITIGVNLDDHLRPTEATLVSINTERFVGSSFVRRLFGGVTRNSEYEGLSDLHSAVKALQSQSFNASLQDKDAPLLVPLFHDLAEILEQSSRPVARALTRYMSINSTFLLHLEMEIAYYLGAVQLIQTIRACGLPMCRPAILPIDAREYHVSEIYNISFALRTLVNNQPCDLSRAIVRNDVHFDDTGRILILTGPNRGGKTTYAQAIGVAQILMQAGLYVPGTLASMSPVDGIYTHFASVEKPESGAGRLGEEAQRLHWIFSEATQFSLILLNESFSSTSARESFFLARDVVLAIRLLSGRAIFATHLHELAADVDAMNAEVEGDSNVVSMVSAVEVDETDESGENARRTYKIIPGPPMGQSYAREIAVQYGISLRQLGCVDISA